MIISVFFHNVVIHIPQNFVPLHLLFRQCKNFLMREENQALLEISLAKGSSPKGKTKGENYGKEDIQVNISMPNICLLMSKILVSD